LEVDQATSKQILSQAKIAECDDDHISSTSYFCRSIFSPELSPQRSPKPLSITVLRTAAFSGLQMPKLRSADTEMINDDDEIQSQVIEDEKSIHIQMDAAFCARMHAAIAAGLERAPTSVNVTPGTKNPKYVSELTAKYYRPPDKR